MKTGSRCFGFSFRNIDRYGRLTGDGEIPFTFTHGSTDLDELWRSLICDPVPRWEGPTVYDGTVS